jgi:hypothetical protein
VRIFNGRGRDHKRKRGISGDNAVSRFVIRDSKQVRSGGESVLAASVTLTPEREYVKVRQEYARFNKDRYGYKDVRPVQLNRRQFSIGESALEKDCQGE